MTYIIGWDMNFKKKTFGNNYSKFPSPSMTLSSKSFLRIVLFFSESLFSSCWYFSSSSKLAISFSRAMIALLSFSLSSMIADSFSIRWNLFVLFRSRLLLPLEAIRRIRRTLSLTWDVIWGFASAILAGILIVKFFSFRIVDCLDCRIWLMSLDNPSLLSEFPISCESLSYKYFKSIRDQEVFYLSY